ncbi:MAG: hypothetical protein WC217_00100 [Candidatus Paceibacterota bacterium]|jgi:hypothetical protein
MPTPLEIKMLSDALRQGDWEIENGPRFAKILDFEINYEALLVLALENKDGEEQQVKGGVKKVSLEGRFGTSHAEPRRFTVSFHDPHRTLLPQALGGVGYWRVLESGDVGLLFVRSDDAPPGWPLYINGYHPYGFEELLKHDKTGENLLRTPRLAQPRALKVGDVLATGERVLSLPREGANSSVLVHLTGGLGGHWIDMAPRLPIALLTEEDNVPRELWERH